MIGILVTSTKGGVGKSTYAISIAAHLGSLADHKVTLLDLDQNGPIQGCTRFKARGGNLEVITVEEDRKNPDMPLRRALKGLEGVSAVVMDGRAGFGVIEENLASIADLAIVPVMPGGQEMDATAHTVRMLQKVRAGGSPKIAIAPLEWGHGPKNQEKLLELEALGEVVLPVVHKSDVFSKAFLGGLTINKWRKSTAKAEMTASIWAALELIKWEI